VQTQGGDLPELAVAVLSLGAELGLEDAVASLLQQSPAPEVVVVNSGGGAPRARLEAAGLAVTVVDRSDRLFPGAVRNLGVAATRAPWVGFLAADCIALPGWVAGRLAAHRAGAHAVASLLVNPYERNRSAAAAALLLHHRRMAHTPRSERLHMGLSFSRELLERLGPFRDDVRIGEDSEFEQRMRAAGVRAVWSDAVRTAHRNPRSPRALVREQYARGSRRRQAREQLGPSVGGLPVGTLIDAGRAWRGTRLETDTAQRRNLRRGWPLLAPGALAYAAGSFVARPRPSRER